tara:strand:+ start:1231 stop:1980 length:750 start_codon:yes stop_codon:yes gene_type:complete
MLIVAALVAALGIDLNDESWLQSPSLPDASAGVIHRTGGLDCYVPGSRGRASQLPKEAKPDCPGPGCNGTAWGRSDSAVTSARTVDFNRAWGDVREDIVRACGLHAVDNTKHCFNDFNHVDCCPIVSENVDRLCENEAPRYPRQSAKFLPSSQLGPAIKDASSATHGDGGSWCTCQLGFPDDICHRAFGARTAFKLVWCWGTHLGALMDDEARVLAHGTPHALKEAHFGHRVDAWRILTNSNNAKRVQM